MKIRIDDLNQIATNTIVKPSDNIFQELGNNTYDYKDLLSELIDNSVAARIQGQLFSQLSEIGIVASKHNDYNVIRGEINLKSVLRLQ